MSTRMSVTSVAAVVFIGLVNPFALPIEAFSPSLATVSRSLSLDLRLFGSKRRGRLTDSISLSDDDNDDGSSKAVTKVLTKKEVQRMGSSKTKKNKTKRSSGGGANSISPLLAEWAQLDTDSSVESTKESSRPVARPSASAANVFVPFGPTEDDDEEEYEDVGRKKKNKRGKKSNERQIKREQRAAQMAAISTQMDSVLEELDDMLQTPNCDVAELMARLKHLILLGNSSSNTGDQILTPALKSLLSSRSSNKANSSSNSSYRLAWVGSDDAICHIGTSLHKVPLARLQEVFLSLGGSSSPSSSSKYRWELYEVIRILGPFPNVRNTLLGDVSIRKSNKRSSSSSIITNDQLNNFDKVRIQVAYNSMVDGTGKEILAGKQDNVKYVLLDVWLANEKAIVCTTVPNDDDKDDDDDNNDDAMMNPFGTNGERVLLFVKEDDLDQQLEKLRAA